MELSAPERENTAWHNLLFPLNLCSHLKLHFTWKGSFMAPRIKYLFHCSFFEGKHVFSQCTRKEDLQSLNIYQNQANPLKIKSTEFLTQSRRRQRGKQESLTQFCSSSPQSGNWEYGDDRSRTSIKPQEGLEEVRIRRADTNPSVYVKGSNILKPFEGVYVNMD